jgi:hypothetical protein
MLSPANLFAPLAVLVAAAVLTAPVEAASSTSTTPHLSAAAGRAPSPPPPRLDSANPAITFDDVPLGTTITDQYTAAGVVFTSDVYTTADSANPTAPVLSGEPQFIGDITARFVVPGTTSSTTVNGFALDVGYIDSRNSVVVDYLDSRGYVVGSQYAQSPGINHLTITYRGVAGFTVRTVSEEPAGYAIDNLTIDPTVSTPVGSIASLGDSYSSGEGRTDGHYDCATDEPKGYYLQDTTVPMWAPFWLDGDCDTRTLAYREPADLYSRIPVEQSNMCHRNGQAYPNLIAQTLQARQSLFVACSGAVTANIGATETDDNAPWVQWPESPVNVAGGNTQLKDLRSFSHDRLGGGDPDVITVGIGGNDAGFSKLIHHCIAVWTGDCKDGTEWADEALSTINGEVFDHLVDTFTTLRHDFPGSTLLAFGYPTVIDPGASCGAKIGFLDGNETRFLGGTVLDAINADVADAAAQAGAYYIDISRVTDGHDVCASDPWINGIVGLGAVESLHPNLAAHAAIGRYFADHYTDGNGHLLVANPEPSDAIRPNVGMSMHLATLEGGPVQQSCGATCIQPTYCVQTCQFTIQGSGYSPGAQLDMVLHSSPVSLGTITADSTGHIATTVTVPQGIEPGLHWLTIDGTGPDGSIQNGTLEVPVYATAPLPTRVRPPAPPVIAPPPPAPVVAKSKPRRVAVKVRVTRRGSVARIRMTCPKTAASSCRVTLRLQIKRTTKKHRTRLVTLTTKATTIKRNRSLTIVLKRASIRRSHARLRLAIITRTSAGTVKTAARIPK